MKRSRYIIGFISGLITGFIGIRATWNKPIVTRMDCLNIAWGRLASYLPNGLGYRVIEQRGPGDRELIHIRVDGQSDRIDIEYGSPYYKVWVIHKDGSWHRHEWDGGLKTAETIYKALGIKANS